MFVRWLFGQPEYVEHRRLPTNVWLAWLPDESSRQA
jgi:hypothetical protein